MSEENLHNKQYTSADIEKYHARQMTPDEMHALEKAALEDPFLADAIEGYDHAEPASISGDIKSLKKRLNERINSGKIKALPVRKSNGYRWMKIAALFVLIFGLGWSVYQFTFNKPKHDIALLENKITPEAPISADTNINSSTTLNINTPKEESKQRVAKTNAENEKLYLSTSVPNSKPLELKAQSRYLASPEIKPPVSLQAPARLEDNARPFFKKADTSREAGIAASDMIKIRGNASVNADSNLLYVANGEVISKQEFDKISPASIQNIEILKDAQASAIYGSRARNGVIVLTLKDEQGDIVKSDYKKKEMQRDQVASNQSYQTNNTALLGKAAPGRQNYFKGQVIDANNNPVPFANVTNTNNNIGTYADTKGNFTLASPDSVLNVQVRSVGFESGNTQLRNDLVKNQVVLQEDRKSLNEVVIIGQGQGKRNKANISHDSRIVLEEPEPADGWTHYNTYVTNNLNPPDDIQENKTTGKVEVSFEVNDKGEPVNIKIEKSLCKKCDEEAIRLIKDGPKWKKKGKRSRAKVSIPF